MPDRFILTEASLCASACLATPELLPSAVAKDASAPTGGGPPSLREFRLAAGIIGRICTLN